MRTAQALRALPRISTAFANGRLSYTKVRALTPLKRAVFARDRRCTFPGCERRHYLDAHHLEHWAHGGETSLENLTLLCTHHHRVLHEGGFSVARTDDGVLVFSRADGRAIPRCGYRTADFVDDAELARTPSAEVREPRAVYRVV